MKRPSRGERWSATTTRQIGFLLLPTRVSLTRTLIEGARLEQTRRTRPSRALALLAAGQLLQVGQLAARQLAHQLPHLAELLDQLPDRLHGRARAARDALAAGAVDEPGVGALLGCHRLDDRLQPVELALVEVDVAELLGPPGPH